MATRQLYRDASKIEYNLKPSTSSKFVPLAPEQRAKRVAQLQEDLLVLPQPGLSAIKENDLHYKVGAIVPEQFKYQYPKPSSEAKQSEVERRKLKNEKARESKRTKQEKIEAANIRPTVRDIMKRMLIKLEKGIIGSETTTRRKQVCTTEPRKK